MLVADILEKKGANVHTIRRDETIGTLSRRLQQERVGVMVVSEDGKTLDGIISERDIAFGLAARRGDLHLVKVSILMTKDVLTCKPTDTLQDATQMMTEGHVRHLVVVDEDGNIAGVVSVRDALEQRMDDLAGRTTALKKIAGMY